MPFLSKILNKLIIQKGEVELYTVLHKYYTKDSPYLVIDAAKGRRIKDDVDFLNVNKSKTASGIRIVPLHPKIRKTLEEWITEK